MISKPIQCDIFCVVVDNYGDAGVCWRLACQLAGEHGWRVRLWIDDPAPLRQLAPDHAGSPFVLTEAALLARDAGDEPGARAILSAAQAQVGSPILGRALASPLSGWPLTLREMTGEARSDQPPGSPR